MKSSIIDNMLNKRLIFCEALLVTAISLIFSYVSIGNFEYRQANIHQDNGPTYYSHILNRDHLFEKDINKELSKFWGEIIHHLLGACSFRKTFAFLS